MAIIKSFSVGNGDMFYIKHGSDNFTVIDCYLNDEETNDSIIDEIIEESKDKSIKRFISTHPDEDHIKGLIELDKTWGIENFYCVNNKATKNNPTEDFKAYCKLRDSTTRYLEKGYKGRWLNQESEKIKSSGIFILWPDLENEEFKKELKKIEENDDVSPNNISPIIKYSLQDGVTCLWMGDIEADFLEKVKDEISFEAVDILFAPHHGRNSGKIPENILKKINPKLIIIGEAPSEYLNYYPGYNTITQNSTKSIILECVDNKVYVYVGDNDYHTSTNFLKIEQINDFRGHKYIGTLEL